MEKITRTMEYCTPARKEAEVTRNLPKALKRVRIVLIDGTGYDQAYLETSEYAFNVGGGTFGKQVKVSDVAEWEYTD